MGGHAHDHHRASQRQLSIALALILAFMAAEVVVGVIANSLALLSDAAHMLTDAAALVVAIVAARVALMPARANFTFGLRRVEILAAQANGITLLLLAAYLIFEAVRRLVEPPQVAGGLVLVTAIVGIAVNLAATRIVSRADRSSLNVEGAYQHVLTDLFAFIATAIAGSVVMLSGWARADAIASLVVAGLMIRSGVGLVASSWRIFLEAAPAHLKVSEIDIAMQAVSGVVEVRDLHVWEVTSGFPALAAQVLVNPSADCHATRQRMAEMLHEAYGIEHATLQVDHAAGDTRI